MFGNIIIGIILIGIGFLFVWKTEWLVINAGRIGFAEKFLGTSGGSRLMYKILGLISIIVGLLYMTGMQDDFLRWFVESVFGKPVPEEVSY
ncbi:hypothetical protein HON36_01145 [Candidatus Parcubacteria bacterium]|jgi:hypothetical protein|nr:hypothetical protein [Candidatus Parcubacteria bacterium]MBT7228210.1 hypothetical protein [Candidatus Parcubacteria bacterium]